MIVHHQTATHTLPHLVLTPKSSMMIGYLLWLDALKHLPLWEIIFGKLVDLGIIVFVFSKFFGSGHAFEKLKMKEKDLDKGMLDAVYFEITIAKNSQTTAFQVQQKILKAFHSIYTDPVEGLHNFGFFYSFQKFWRIWKVRRARQVFFNMQIWAQHPYISFRLQVPASDFSRLEKAIFNAYPNAEITILDKNKALEEITKFPKGFLSFGETTIEGQFYHRVKTLKDVSSDPVDSIISTMEGLKKGQFMVYNVLVSPSSHYFNQLIHHFIEQQEQQGAVSQGQKKFAIQKYGAGSELANATNSAMIEKMKAPLFQTIVSYLVVAETKENAEAKLRSIQGVLTEINQKNMNMLKHHKLFTKRVGKLSNSGKLKSIVDGKPVFKLKRFFLSPFTKFKNFGQILSDSELYSFWHLPNTAVNTVSSIRLTKFKKLPASQQLREHSDNFFISLGHANFRMQEQTPIGIATWEDMKKHVYILGGTGSGKSETLKTILKSLLTNKTKIPNPNDRLGLAGTRNSGHLVCEV